MRSATLPCVLDDAAALADILREHGALAGNQSFALANALVAAGAIDLARLPDLLAWRHCPSRRDAPRALEPAPHRRWPADRRPCICASCVGSALAAPGADLLRRHGRRQVGNARSRRRWAGSSAAPGISVLALPRAPQSLLQAVRQGRAAQREVGAQLFASQRHPQAARGGGRTDGGDQRASLRRRAVNGGEVRLSLSSPFDPREAEGFRCPLYPLETGRRSRRHADGLPGANAASRTCAWFRACMATAIRRPGCRCCSRATPRRALPVATALSATAALGVVNRCGDARQAEAASPRRGA